MFRKKGVNFHLARYVPNLKEKRTVLASENGSVNVVEVVSSDSDASSLPSPETFSLSACKKAGINLDPVSSVVLPITDESVFANHPLFNDSSDDSSDDSSGNSNA